MDDVTQKIPMQDSAKMQLLMAGQKMFERYTLVRQLGQGGMGEVWLARDEKRRDEVALKFLIDNVRRDPEAIRDLVRETNKCLRLTHANIVRVHDFLEDRYASAIAMEYIPGRSLSALKVERPGGCFDAAALLPLVRQLCAALDYAHKQALFVHRDLKPANIMVTDAGVLKVADFGIARSLRETQTQKTGDLRGASGTLAYMGPQQLDGQQAAPSDDIYALGATLYDLLTGKPPFYSGDIFQQIRTGIPTPMEQKRKMLENSGPPIPPEWERTIMACLAKRAEDRPRSAGEVLARLEGQATDPDKTQVISDLDQTQKIILPAQAQEILRSAPPPSKRRRMIWLAAGAAAVVMLAALGWYFLRHRPETPQTETAHENAPQAEPPPIAPPKREETKPEVQRPEPALLTAEQQRLANARGGLIITSNPSDAEVTVGGFAIERTPVTIKEAKLGKYPVMVRLADYEDLRTEVEVKENEFARLNFELMRSTGAVQLASTPAGLEVEVERVEGNARHPQTVKTPVKMGKLPTGTYALTFRRQGWPEQRQTVAVRRNQTATAQAEFAGGQLEIASTPAGAEVWSQGKRLGVTPLSYRDQAPGGFALEFRLKGHQEAKSRGEVRAKETTRVAVTLEKFRGPETGQVWTIPDLGLTLMPIKPGTFTMGSENGNDNERPLTRVTLTKPYWLGKTEVTQREWAAVMESKPSNFNNAGLPVEQVSWEDAMEFCRKLTERERLAGRVPDGYAFTLPTEAQWEFSCRAGTTEDFAGELDEMGWYDQNSENTTHPAGSKRANAWGLYDMHGNVWEWCLDWYADKLPGGNVRDYAGPAEGNNRVNRGGSWVNFVTFCRSANRNFEPPALRNSFIGFRLALAPQAAR